MSFQSYEKLWKAYVDIFTAHLLTSDECVGTAEDVSPASQRLMQVCPIYCHFFQNSYSNVVLLLTPSALRILIASRRDHHIVDAAQLCEAGPHMSCYQCSPKTTNSRHLIALIIFRKLISHWMAFIC